MNDDEIRALVRVAIQKHLGTAITAGPPDDRRGGPSDDRRGGSLDPLEVAVSMSFGRYALPRAADDGMCLIEPAVRCNQCGYCECHGH